MLFPLFVFLELSKRIVTTESFLTFISMEGKWNEIITSDKSKLIFNEETLWSSYQRCSAKKGVLGNFTKFIGKYLCQSLFFNKVGSEDLAQVFSSEFREILKTPFIHNTFGRLLLNIWSHVFHKITLQEILQSLQTTSVAKSFFEVNADLWLQEQSEFHHRQSLFLSKVGGLRPQACNFTKKETLARIFFCFRKIFKNAFFTEHRQGTVSKISTF